MHVRLICARYIRLRVSALNLAGPSAGSMSGRLIDLRVSSSILQCNCSVLDPLSFPLRQSLLPQYMCYFFLYPLLSNNEVSTGCLPMPLGACQ